MGVQKAVEGIDTADLVLLILGAGEGRSGFRGITRLEKILFLLSKEVPHPENVAVPEFEGYKFGPFSKDVYDSLEFLRSINLVNADDSPSTDDALELSEVDPGIARFYEPRTFRLTRDGRIVWDRLLGKLPSSFRDALLHLVTRYGGLSLPELIRYVYAQYPEYTSKSLIRGKVLPR